MLVPARLSHGGLLGGSYVAGVTGRAADLSETIVAEKRRVCTQPGQELWRVVENCDIDRIYKAILRTVGVQAYGGGGGATSVDFDLKGQAWEWGDYGLDQVCHGARAPTTSNSYTDAQVWPCTSA